MMIFFVCITWPLTRTKDPFLHVALPLYCSWFHLCFQLNLLHSKPYFFFLCHSSSHFFVHSFWCYFLKQSSLSQRKLDFYLSMCLWAFTGFWWNWQTWWVVIIVVSLKTLLRSLTFLFGSMTVMLAVLLFWIYFVAYNSSLCFAESFPLLGNSHVVVSVSTSFPIISNDDIWALYYFVLIGID